MKLVQSTTKILLFCTIIFFLSCSSTQKFVPEEPKEGKALLVGAVLVENDGVEDVYEAKTAKITVVIVGKAIVNGKEEARGYRLKTDRNGYFALANVPPGSYVVKGIEVDIGYSTRLLLTSRWEGNTQIYYPTEVFIDNNVRVWPKAANQKIINLGIRYFRIDQSKRVFDQVFSSLNNTPLALKNATYTMEDPAKYFQKKFPDWGWFR
ncbi:MAG TPA: carboxypeptidase regulatory-like domain-containing protein [Caldithrix sp.]|nr:carboxypeptidase regulatory-like domain-containing protein [Caldithrix sp.]